MFPIEAFGSTSLTEFGNNFYLYTGGSGPSLKYAAAAAPRVYFARNGVDDVDIVFSCGATMRVNDEIFAAAKQQALRIARKAIVHLEYNAWTPAELQNGRNWRSSFLSDRWVRDYVVEYESLPGVARVECFHVPAGDQHREKYRSAGRQ